MTDPKTMLVRIHPRNPQRGFLCRNFTLSGSGYPKFQESRGWYVVDAAIVPRLRQQLNNPSDPASRPIFQICTQEEAIALEEAERVRVAEASAPIAIPKSRLVQIGSAARPARAAVVKEAPARPTKPTMIETADPLDPEDAGFVPIEVPIEEQSPDLPPLEPGQSVAEEKPQDDLEQDLEEWPDDLSPERVEPKRSPTAVARSRAKKDKKTKKVKKS